MNKILETERLYLRKIQKEDFQDLCKILQDIEVLYAWEHSFTEEEVYEWIDKNLARYEKDGFSYYATITKEHQQFVGVVGPLVDDIDGVPCVEIAYIFAKEFWGQGFAYESAKVCMDYALNTFGITQMVAQIRPDNLSSIKLAKKLGMQHTGEFIKHYRGKDMVHHIYTKKTAEL